jgi:HK97 gp10 family phage protein
MATSRQARIQGAAKLAADFNRMAASVRGPVLAEAAKAGGIVISTAAKNNLTANKSRKSTNLFRSINVQVASQSADSASVSIGTNVEYGPYVEYGTGIHGPKGAEIQIRYTRRGSSRFGVPKRITVEYKHPGMRAKPYLEPALESKADEAYKTVAKAVWLQVKAAAQ